MHRFRFGFSAHGTAVAIAALLPNFAYLLWRPAYDPLAANDAGFWLWNVLENAGRAGLMLALVLLVYTAGRARPKGTLAAALCFLAVYYGLWAGYLHGFASPPLLLGLALTPVLYFVCASLWLRNRPAVWMAVMFGVVHVGITAINFVVV